MEEEFGASLTNADSTKVIGKLNEIMDMLHNKEIDKALSQLCEVNEEGQVAPLGAERRKQLTTYFTQFPVLRYELDYFAFSISTLNDVKYNITFKEPDHKISFMLNPIKIDGAWYICTKQEGMHSKTEAKPINPAIIID
jgi:ribosomal protein L22